MSHAKILHKWLRGKKSARFFALLFRPILIELCIEMQICRLAFSTKITSDVHFFWKMTSHFIARGSSQKKESIEEIFCEKEEESRYRRLEFESIKNWSRRDLLKKRQIDRRLLPKMSRKLSPITNAKQPTNKKWDFFVVVSMEEFPNLSGRFGMEINTKHVQSHSD